MDNEHFMDENYFFWKQFSAGESTSSSGETPKNLASAPAKFAVRRVKIEPLHLIFIIKALPLLNTSVV